MEALVSCCSEKQVVLLADWAFFLATCLLLWHSRILFPLKLFTVFLHEFSHATAVWLTCNKVTGIEVNENLGGLTHWSATPNRMKCAQWIVLPAGYLGSALWGGIILVCCAEPFSTRAVAFVLIFAFGVALGYTMCGTSKGHRRFLAMLSLFSIIVLVGLLYVCYCTTWRWRDVLLSTVLLLVGAMNTLFATYDIWEDCIARSIPQSDAFKFATLTHCCTPVCIGVLWLLLSLLMAVGMLWLAIWRSSGDGPLVHDLEGVSTFSRICISCGAACLATAVVFRLCFSQTYQAQHKHRGVSLEDEGDDEEFADESGAVGTSSSDSTSEASSDEVQLTTGSHGSPPLAADL